MDKGNDAVPVTAEAREAAARWAKLNSRSQQAANIRRGSCDTAPIVQAFARFERDILARHRGSTAVESPRHQKYLADETAARASLATFPDAVRQRLTDWQEGQSEWFSDTLLEVVAEFIAFDDASRAGGMENKAGGLWYRRWHTAQTRGNELEMLLANPAKHKFWGAGEPECPREIKAPNGEIHTLRCKACGLDNPRKDNCFASLSQTPATRMDELQRLGQEYDGAVTIPTDHPHAKSLRTSQKTLDEIARQEQANIAGYMALRDFPVGSASSPMVREGLREALAGHFPTGLRSLYARTAGGIPVRGGGIAVECKCGWSTVATDDDEARQQWADHVAALSATPAPPVDETDRLPRLDTGLIEAALIAHYGKSGAGAGIDGVDLTVNDRQWTFREGFQRMWTGVRKELKRRAALADRTQEGEVRRG